MGSRLVVATGMAAGMMVLDVVTGMGNAALSAAALGARVWGLDRSPGSLALARRTAAASGRTVRWVQAEPVAIPFADASFDRVITSSGVLSPSDHLRMVRELARVCRPGGVVGLCHWTPNGLARRVVDALASDMPGLGDDRGSVPSVSFANEDHLGQLFSAGDMTIDFERIDVLVELDSADDFVRLVGEHVLPSTDMKRPFRPVGPGCDVGKEITSVLEAVNQTPGAGWTARQQCLLAIVRKPTALRRHLNSIP